VGHVFEFTDFRERIALREERANFFCEFLGIFSFSAPGVFHGGIIRGEF